MIIYCNNQQLQDTFLKRSFICRKIQEIPRFWNFRLFSDHLSPRDYRVLLKCIATGQPIIFLSIESSVHGARYWRPYKFATYNISHKCLSKKNTLFYPVIAEEELSESLNCINPKQNKSSKVLFVSSNWNKINYVARMLRNDFNDLDFFGSFSRPVPSVTGDFHVDSQHLMSNYKAVIVLENSQENGYIQGNFMRAVKAGAVPIIQASEWVRTRVLAKGSYVNFDDYVLMSEAQRKSAIEKSASFYSSGGRIFSPLMREFLDFLHEANYDDFDRMIVGSQFFRDKIFDS